tara:strand:+ start:99 stop:509 length:411 start_codon:yes stop_codon:yes gene_type:complete
MGLDQYAWARKGEPCKDEEGYNVWPEGEEELAYWRKHPNLQGWMENLWHEKGCPDGNEETANSMFGSDFNCVDLELTLEDLDALEQSLDESALPETAGFFFGNDSTDHYAEADRDFIVQARAAINQGYKVVYSSWW